MDLVKFRTILDQSHKWPCLYTFKFVIPASEEQNLLGLLPLCKLSKRVSKSGNYLSITAQRKMANAADVVKVYERVAGIEGIITM